MKARSDGRVSCARIWIMRSDGSVSNESANGLVISKRRGGEAVCLLQEIADAQGGVISTN